MTRAAPTCSFCAAHHGEVELLFRSPLGGEPPFICSDCLAAFNALIRLHRIAPAEAERLIAEHNAGVARERRQ